MNDYWLQDFNRAKALTRDIALEIKKRDNAASGSSGRGKHTAIVRGQIAQLAQEISHLEQAVSTSAANPPAYNITTKELTRRRDKVAKLQQEREQLEETFREGFRSGLTEPLSHGSTATSASTRLRHTEDELHNMSDQDIMMLQEKSIHEQDAALEFLEGSVHNLKSIGGNINQEINLHVRLIGDIDADAERTRHQLKQNQTLLVRVLQRSSYTCLYALILILSVTLIVLLIVL
ncbi:unnamed protein product [Vitrella brassicaformis CCMP3155]|uniref:t-SNARE coiled-coil homology domain-containing protein n=2 Tax=Vitrella brassicaformis TaxID=1169539 RepID=A0A0G4F7X0_VITBC|nr:unnamed protein product [Vitrella brassicaformis CCMP3155]|eukprot:CEM08648.1 unnamed protein product [Vitrella brassicaformis CCMP3155]